MLKEKYETLLERAESLEKRARQIRHHIGLQQSWNNISDSHRRLFLNNEALGFRNPTLLYPVDKLYQLPLQDKRRILDMFAQRGDPLAQKVLDWMYKNNHYQDDILQHSDIPVKLLTRKMKEKKYFDYLNGKIPIAEIKSTPMASRKHYLPKEEVVKDN